MIITADGIEILNAARKILERADRAAMSEGYEGTTRSTALGRVAETADVAAAAIFSFLNTATNYGGVPMTHEQLHGRPETKEETT